MDWEERKSRLAEAVDFALANGLIKLGPGGIVHAPFTLLPCPIPPSLDSQLQALTEPFNRLAHALAQDLDFLTNSLAPLAVDDPFLSRLLSLAKPGREAQPIQFYLTRGDYLLQSGGGGALPRPLQVELNTISVSYPALAGIVARLHLYLDKDSGVVANDPLPGIAAGFVAAHKRFGRPGIVAMVVQPGERNLFDQRMLEFALRERGLAVRRVTMAQLGEEGALRGGNLVLGGEVVAIAYLRAGYGPEDYPAEAAWRGRELIEHSSAIALPSAAAQLAGSKKIQQLIAVPETLSRFCAAEEASLLAETFAGLHDPEAPIPAGGQTQPAWRVAMDQPENWVLKPQREGGGNNLFDDELRRFLTGSTPEERAPYILMERIRPPERPSLLVSEGALREDSTVTEIGRFGVLLAEGGNIAFNHDVGYLARTKPAHVAEGGVSAGFGYLDSLALVAPDQSND